MSDETKLGSDTRDERKAVGLWDQTKAWAANNRTISGALVGGAAGIIVPGAGPLIGSIVGAGIGFASSRESKKEELEPPKALEPARSRRGEHV
jgi:hypothetical protein